MMPAAVVPIIPAAALSPTARTAAARTLIFLRPASTTTNASSNGRAATALLRSSEQQHIPSNRAIRTTCGDQRAAAAAGAAVASPFRGGARDDTARRVARVTVGTGGPIYPPPPVALHRSVSAASFSTALPSAGPGAGAATSSDSSDASSSSSDPSSSSSIANDLVRAELSGLSGNDDAYDALLSDLSDALEKLERTAAAASGGGSEQEQHDMIAALQSAGRAYWNLGLLDESKELFEDVLTRLIDLHSSSTDGGRSDDQAASAVSGGGSDPSASSPPDHPDVASTLHTLGSIHARTGQGSSTTTEEAVRWYESSLAMKRRLYGKRTYHPEIGKTLNGLAMLRARSDVNELVDDHHAAADTEVDWTMAMRMFEDAERNYKYHGMDMGGGGRIGFGSARAGRPAAARKSFIDAPEGTEEDDAEEVEWSDHPDVASINENMAELYRRNGQFDAALVRYQEALRVRELWVPAGGRTDETIVGLTLSIADCLRATSRWDEAADMYEAALEDHLRERRNAAEGGEEGGGNENEDGGEEEAGAAAGAGGTALESVIRHNLGIIHSEQGRYELALDEYAKSHRIKVGIAGDSHPEVASTLNAMGAVHGAMGDRNAALAHFREALFVYRMHAAELGDDDPDVVKAMRNIALIEKSGSEERRRG